MLDREILSINEENPLSPARAAGLISAYPGLAPLERPARDVRCAAGRARGRLVGADDADGPWVCAIGAFDGFHAGHQKLIARAREKAEAIGARVCAVTFTPDPAEVLGSPAPASRLVEPRLRPELLLRGGADAVLSFDFDLAFAALGYDEFVRGALLGVLDARAVVVGSDFRMGAKGAGTVDALAALGRELGIDVVGVELLDEGGRHVTATRIRGLVREGRVEAAAGLMGRCACARGRVGHGRGEGTSFGFPTANVLTDKLNCVPEQGVYACFVTPLGSDAACAFPAAVNVGLPPTFADAASGDVRRGETLLEANLIGFDGDLYGADVVVTFVRWLRDSRPFDSVDELKRTVLGNISWVRDCLGDAAVDLRAGEVVR